MCAVPDPAKTTHAGAFVAVTGEIDFSDGAAIPDLDVVWIHGSEASKYNTDPDIQVHACDEHTYILRQNMAVSYEAPFMFLLFGGSQALLLDTGATANPRFFPLRRSSTAGWPTTRIRTTTGCSSSIRTRTLTTPRPMASSPTGPTPW